MEDGFFLRSWQAVLAGYDAFKGVDWEWMHMDGAVTKAPLAGEKTGPSPVDRAKQGTKRSLLVEAGGVPVALSVAGANLKDFTLLEETHQSIPVDQPEATQEYLQHLCLDKGDDFEEVRHILHAYGLVTHIRARGEEAKVQKKKKRGEKARRWVVERTHSWFNRFRRILTRWSKKERNYLGMLYFVCALISYRAAGLSG